MHFNSVCDVPVLQLPPDNASAYCCYVYTQFYLALYMCVFILNGSPMAIFRTGFPFVEYCSGGFRSILQSDY